uniref:WGS project CBMI000000000 data, contig CS3069_c004095 n=1 Tax=Fusarium clavum TaxID=2594811 RepID=A0A090MK94_9HYPO|nr:unnamed protein product [Fusarium clavum]
MRSSALKSRQDGSNTFASTMAIHANRVSEAEYSKICNSVNIGTSIACSACRNDFIAYPRV